MASFKRLFAPFSPSAASVPEITPTASYTPSAVPFAADESAAATPSHSRSAEYADFHDARSPLLQAKSDDDRVAHLKREAYRRLEYAREYFDTLLQLQNGPSTVDEWIASLEDGSFLVMLLQRVTGVIDRTPSKMTALGAAGLVPENFER